MNMREKRHVVYVTPEVAPYAKSGEMADVASSLPKHLSQLGLQVSVFMPLYRSAEIESLAKDLVLSPLPVPMGEKVEKARVYRSELGKFDLYLVDNPRYYWREHIYGTGRDEYLDNDERFVFFNRAVLEFIVKANIPVDILHCNNWPAALIPVFIRTHYARIKRLRQAAVVMTLHNVAFQGEFPPDSLIHTGMDWDALDSGCLSVQGKLNFLKAGVLYADVINTVSSTYRRQILTRRHGFGMEDVLRSRRDRLHSIRNGIDYEIWDPRTDPYITANYAPPDYSTKSRCRQGLLQDLGLELAESACLLGIVSYIAPHKGFDILTEAMDELMELDIGLVVMGKGDEEWEAVLERLQARYPQKLAIKLDLSPGSIHKLVAGVDVILVPSRYEPCGLSQLYGFRYGTVPLVRATGGLKETVIPFDRRRRQGNGFVFQPYTARALLEAVREVVSTYAKSRVWTTLMRAGLRRNFSWKNAALRHIKLYENALKIKRGG